MRSYYTQLDKPKTKGYEEKIKKKDEELKAEEAKSDPPRIRPARDDASYQEYLLGYNQNKAVGLFLNILCLAETRQRIVQLQRHSRTSSFAFGLLMAALHFCVVLDRESQGCREMQQRSVKTHKESGCHSQNVCRCNVFLVFCTFADNLSVLC